MQSIRDIGNVNESFRHIPEMLLNWKGEGMIFLIHVFFIHVYF